MVVGDGRSDGDEGGDDTKYCWGKMVEVVVVVMVMMSSVAGGRW